MPDNAPLRIGFVPEHFSTPLHYAVSRFGLSASLIPFPSGTGHMISALRAGEIDVGIGLTEAWIAGLATPRSNGSGSGVAPAAQDGYQLVGTYVETPLCWAILTGSARDDVRDVAGLHGARLGVSRIGSGSFVMASVLAAQRGWLKDGGSGSSSSSSSSSSGSSTAPYKATNLHHTFAGLRAAVNDPAQTDFFMWEHFTSKRYYAGAEAEQHGTDPVSAPAVDRIKKLGEIYTPWPSWHIVAADANDARLPAMFKAINEGVGYFEDHPDENVQYISTALDYTADDAREWLKTVRFAKDAKGVRRAVVLDTLKALETAGVSEYRESAVAGMIGLERQE